MTLNVASFVSSGGTTMEKAFQAIKAWEVPWINPALVVASKRNIWAIEKALKLGVPREILKDTKDPVEILQLLYQYKIDIVFQNGYLPMMPKEVIQVFSREAVNAWVFDSWETGRENFINNLDDDVYNWLMSKDRFSLDIFNQHPGPVRADHRDFGGKGMYGSRVTAARALYLLMTWAKGDDVFTESTVQCVHPEFDKWVLLSAKRLNFPEEFEEFKDAHELNTGNIWSRIVFPSVQDAIRGFTEKIQKLLLPIEHENVIELLQKIGRREELEEDPIYRESLVPEDRVPVLEWAKTQGGVLFPKG